MPFIFTPKQTIKHRHILTRDYVKFGHIPLKDGTAAQLHWCLRQQCVAQYAYSDETTKEGKHNFMTGNYQIFIERATTYGLGIVLGAGYSGEQERILPLGSFQSMGKTNKR